MKKYSKIVRHGKKGTHLTIEGNPEITITEKLDGSNVSLRMVDGKLKCFSRNQELTKGGQLQGFYNWAHEDLNCDLLISNYIYFGEFLVKHKLDYGDNMGKFYLFDVYDTNSEEYLPFDIVKSEAGRLSLSLVPIFYEGKFQSMEHIQSFVGKSKLGEIAEGIIVKNYNYNNKFGEQVFTKIVSDEFAEKAKVKKHVVKNELDEFVSTYLTKARVEKILYKLIDEGIIEENPEIEDIGVILKNSASRVVDDILEEEMDSLTKIVKKKISKKYPQMLKEILS